jgi:Flp pilus assembly protein TadG
MILIPVVGLAIDFSMLYNVKGRLQTACDAAAIGAGNMLQRSTDLTNATQVANIKDTAQRFFKANYPTGYWGSTQVYYDSTPSEDASKTRTIYVHAAEYVPMLFMRVIGVSQSTVAAQASVKVRFVNLMIVVDRSGSVVYGGADTSIKNALSQFVATSSTSVFVDGRDVVGMVSFSGNWKLDFAPITTFDSSTPNIQTAINNIPFTIYAFTNTAEGLYQGYHQLQLLNQPGALNVIVLLTDGRPSAFSSDHFKVKAGSPCTDKTDKSGFIAAYVGATALQWPPPQSVPNAWGILTVGVFKNTFTGVEATFPSNSAGCAYTSTPDGSSLSLDINPFPTVDNHGNSTTGPVYVGEGTSTADPRAVRYASFNAADNMATTIRSDTVIRPVMFVIGLNESTGEPLDADWLGRVANDPGYKDTNGNSVFQNGQTPGMYFNVSASGLGGAFQEIASQILRLSQ